MKRSLTPEAQALRREVADRMGLLFDTLERANPEKNARAQLAALMGVGKSAVSNWTSKTKPDLPTVEPMLVLCRWFNLTLDFIYRGEARSVMDAEVLAAFDQEKRRAAAASRQAERKRRIAS